MKRSIRYVVFSRFLFVLGGFFLLTCAALYYFTDRVLTQFFTEDHSRTLGFIANNVASNYREDLRALERLAEADGLSPYRPARAKELLHQFFEFENVYGSVHVYDANGDLRLAVRRNSVPAYRIEKSFREKVDGDFIRSADAVLRNGRPRATKTFHRSNGDAYQIYLVPLMSRDAQGKAQVAGLLSGAVFYKNHGVQHLLEGLRLGGTNFIVLSDSDGRALLQDGIRNPDNVLLLGPPLQQASRRLASRNGFAHFALGMVGVETDNPVEIDEIHLPGVAPDADTRYAIFSAPVPELRLLLTLGVNLKTIEYKRLLLMRWILVALVAGFIVCFVAAAFIGNRLSLPLQQLLGAVRRLERGDFSRPLPVNSEDEFGRLCESVNRLGAKIERGRWLGHLWSRASADEGGKHERGQP